MLVASNSAALTGHIKVPFFLTVVSCTATSQANLSDTSEHNSLFHALSFSLSLSLFVQ